MYSNSLPFYLKPFFLSQDTTLYLLIGFFGLFLVMTLPQTLCLMTDSGSFKECTQAFCRQFLSGDWCDVFLMSSWGLWVWGREATQINILSHHIFKAVKEMVAKTVCSSKPVSKNIAGLHFVVSLAFSEAINLSSSSQNPYSLTTTNLPWIFHIISSFLACWPNAKTWVE